MTTIPQALEGITPDSVLAALTDSALPLSLHAIAVQLTGDLSPSDKAKRAVAEALYDLRERGVIRSFDQDLTFYERIPEGSSPVAPRPPVDLTASIPRPIKAMIDVQENRIDPITRAFDSLSTLPDLEGGFLRWLLLQAINDPELATNTQLAEHLHLVPQVVRALPLGLVRILRDNPHGSVGHKTIAVVAQNVAADRNDISFETLSKLSLVSLRDAAFLQCFLEGRPASPFLMDESPIPDSPVPPVTWRNLTFERHSPGVWLTSDRLWRLTNVAGEAHWVAYLQLDPGLFIMESAETAAGALDKLTTRAKNYGFKLWAALDQVDV